MEQDIFQQILLELKSLKEGQEATNKRLDSVDARFDQVDARLDKMQEDLEILKEDTKVTRASVNTLLDWAEDAQIEVKIPLYKRLNKHKESGLPSVGCPLVLYLYRRRSPNLASIPTSGDIIANGYFSVVTKPYLSAWTALQARATAFKRSGRNLLSNVETTRLEGPLRRPQRFSQLLQCVTLRAEHSLMGYPYPLGYLAQLHPVYVSQPDDLFLPWG